MDEVGVSDHFKSEDVPPQPVNFNMPDRITQIPGWINLCKLTMFLISQPLRVSIALSKLVPFSLSSYPPPML